MRRLPLLLGLLLSVVATSQPRAEEGLKWQGWSAEVFAKAKAEQRFVILDLEAVWCHWCHVMEATTYQDPKVVELLKSKYLMVRVDQDANPDLSNRYGDWGWPATIIFAPDGTELVKRRGYVPPEGMAGLLEAVIADPTPGPSVSADADVVPSTSALLTAEQRAALATAEKAASYIVANRRAKDGVFLHGAEDRAGPYLGDSVAMGQAALDLYAATGKRDWLKLAADAGGIIDTRFKDSSGGFFTTLKAESTFLKPLKIVDEQVQVARFANRLHRYFGSETFHALAEHATRYLAADAILEQSRPMPGILIADHELGVDPTHITILGHKTDAAAVALDTAARAYPVAYKRLDWWDTTEGPLPNPDVTYPELDQAAAFICTNRICSLPMFTPQELDEKMHQMTGRKVPSRS